jgi:hypothetical protein
MKELFFSHLKILSGILIIVLIISCKPSDEIKTGIYKYYRPGRIEFGLRYIFQGVVGFHCTIKQLTISKDSTFAYDFYSGMDTGTWKYMNDSLYLNVKGMIFTDEKLNIEIQKTPLPANFKPIVFKVNGDCLIRIYGEKRHKILTKLKFDAP